MADNVIKRLVDAGVEFTGVSQAKAESLVRKLVRDGELRRRDAEAAIAALVDRGKDTAETIVVTLQRELSAQLDKLAVRIDDVERRVEEVIGMVARTTGAATAGTTPAAPVTPAAPKKAAAKKVAAPNKAAAKKVGAKKAAPKKAAADKAAPKKAAAKKAASRGAGATGPSGVRRVSTSAR